MDGDDKSPTRVQIWEQTSRMHESAIIADQELAKRYAVCASLAMIPVCGVSAWLAGNAIAPILIAATVFGVLSVVMLRVKGRTGRVLLALSLFSQGFLVAAALAGHPWHIESYGFLFIFMAMLTDMRDRAVIVAALAYCLVRQLVLVFVAPELIFPPAPMTDHLQRFAVHSIILAISAVFFILVVTRRATISNHIRETQGKLATAMQSAEDARLAAEEAVQQSECARARAEAARADAEMARKSLEESAETARRADETARRAEAERQQASAETAERQQYVVGTLRAALSELANRNLTARIDTPLDSEHDPVRLDYNAALDGLAEAIATAARHSEQVEIDSEAIGQQIAELTNRTERQADTLEAATDTITTIMSRVKVAADGARRVDDLVKTTHASAQTAESVVTRAAAAMSEIREVSGRISSIVQQIGEISFQTNLLALNAGIEAARAGDAGRGFAVVAAEVGALARRTAKAAEEISGLAQHSSERVSEGTGLVEDTEAALHEIEAHMTELLATASAIATAAEEQSTHFEEVGGAVGELETMTEHNARMVEASNAAVNELRRSAQVLSRKMREFRIGTEAARPRLSA
ncbi:methyl-accepting chemotaxis protein [Jannaschia marina]|uniref:methyl-accepting chemotaxis protein n=1 Tax=Jannaschia marina TaxID=2741674 RepID=UPI0015C9FA57|nr:methyl-accepting chemotaxis protein [Jannaschia marina]